MDLKAVDTGNDLESMGSISEVQQDEIASVLVVVALNSTTCSQGAKN